MATQDSRVHQDQLDNPESLAYLALREVMVGQELLDLKVPRGRRVTQVKLDPQDHLEMTESTAPEDHQGPKGKRVSLESKEDQDQGDHLVWRDPKAILEPLVSLATLGSRVLVVSRENLAILVTMAGRETEAFKATPALLVNLAYRDLLGNRECLVHLASKEMLDPQEQRETLDHLDLRDFRGHLVIRVLQDLKDHLA